MFRSTAELEAGLEWVRQSPRSAGRVEAIVVRPARGKRHEPEWVRLEKEVGAVGDVWGGAQSSPSLPLPAMPAEGRSSERDSQLTLMNARAVALVASTRDRWALAGDQVYVDFDLSADHLQAGDRLRLGGAVVEVTALPHNGCRKFEGRFGTAALAWVNSVVGKRLHLRGIYVRVVEPGEVRVGDEVAKVAGK